MKAQSLADIPSLKDKRQKTFSLILIFVVGVLIVGLSSLLTGFFRTLLTSIGSVVIGFGLTSVISLIFSPAPFEGVLNMINELLALPWRSKEEDLIRLRKRFFGYLYTFRDGKGIWLYREFDFGNFEIPSYLHALIQYPSLGSTIARYKYYGMPVGNRLLLIGINAMLKNEPAVIQIIPNCGQSGIYAGLAFLETIAGKNILTPTIISHQKLLNIETPGPIDPAISEPLNEIWAREFKNEIHIPKAKLNQGVFTN